MYFILLIFILFYLKHIKDRESKSISDVTFMYSNTCTTGVEHTGDNIRIYHECEGRIEKSVPRITPWHHEAIRLMTNGDPEGQIFQSYPHTNGFFFLLTTVFTLK